MTVLSKLQQYNFTQENINHKINYLKTKTTPTKLNSRQRKAFIKKFDKDLIVEKSRLILICILVSQTKREMQIAKNNSKTKEKVEDKTKKK